MSTIDRLALVLFLIYKWFEAAEASTARNNNIHKINNVSNILNSSDLPESKNVNFKKNEKEINKGLPRRGYGSVFMPMLESIERYRGQLGLELELHKINLYYAVDYSNDPIVSQYPKDGKSDKYRPQSHFYKIKRPNYYTLVKDFLNLFTHNKQENESAVFSLKQLETGLPNAVMLFMDPNSCAEHVIELNKQDKEAKMASTKLNTVYKFFETGLNFYRDRDTVDLVIPFSESLVYATNKGGTNFNGTPVFTTDPPLYVTRASNYNNEDDSNTPDDKFNSQDKLVVFFTPSEAKEFYKKVRWEKAYTDERTGKVYRIWSKSAPYRPDVRVTSLEKVYKRVHSSEPFWGYLLEFMPPSIKIEKRTEFMIKESNNWLLVPWYSLRKLLRGVLN